jgi:SAM-dependent methyltransferase
VLLEIAAEGIACTGVDASAAMLARLRAKPGAERVRLVQATMQDFDLGSERFALVYSAFRAFQHLCAVEDQLRCLERVKAHLAPGGAFAFDVFNGRLERLALDEEPEQPDLRFELEGDPVVRYVRVRRNRAEQTQELVMRYERSRAGRVVEEQEVSFQMRWFHRFELEHLLARAGFADVRILGDFDGAPLAPASPALLVVARVASA